MFGILILKKNEEIYPSNIQIKQINVKMLICQLKQTLITQKSNSLKTMVEFAMLQTTYSIIADIAGCSPKMYDGGSSWTTSAKCMDMSHDVMTSFLLFQCCSVKVNVVKVRLHLRNLFISDGKAKGLQIVKISNNIISLETVHL